MFRKPLDTSFLFLLGISVILHLALFAGLYYAPHPEEVPPQEPTFIDLQTMPTLRQPPEKNQQETKRLAEERSRVAAERAPRGDSALDLSGHAQGTVEGRKPATTMARPSAQSPATTGNTPIAPGSSVTSLLKPKEQRSLPTPSAPQLFPKANRLAKLEESYRRKFENDITEGDTRFLNSDDIVFGSFLRRFEGAIYGVWRYPQEAAMKGIEGITPVRITFNRRGEITNIQQLESSGARILDEEVLRTLRAIGPVGGFPKGYDKEEFHLIAFFQYGGARRSLR